MSDFVPTSLARRLITKLQATHEKRRISVFAGPPGIGKTTAVDTFRERFPMAVAIIKIERANARELLVLELVLEAIRALAGVHLTYSLGNLLWLRREIYKTLERLVEQQADQGASKPRLTIVFDEAQNLSREAIEALRYWNDRDRCYAPFPIGFAFVGNNEFSLRATGSSGSTISAAVADRALYVESFEYLDVTNEDIRLYVTSRLEAYPEVAEALSGHFTHPGAPRSLRRIANLIDELYEEAPGGRPDRSSLEATLELSL